jgi:lipopolysaccharide export system protein LptC
MEHLIEPGLKTHFNDMFDSYKHRKMEYYTAIMNIILLLVFIAGGLFILYVKKKNKLTPAQRIKKNEDDRNYIIHKIKSLQLNKHGLLS